MGFAENMDALIGHYDLLVAEGNDPVHDPPELQEYMDQWDGQAFLDALALDPGKSVLEIGVGTGRLAVRIAPLCGRFCGIDVSPGSIRRAKENLDGFGNVRLVLGDFLTAELEGPYDVVCSSLTFLHIRQKQAAVEKAARLLAPGGRLVLSLDKSQEPYLDYGTRRIGVYPDDPERMTAMLEAAGLELIARFGTPFAHILAARKK